MKAMFDINVVLDIVGRREPFLAASEAAFMRAVEDIGRPMLSSFVDGRDNGMVEKSER